MSDTKNIKKKILKYLSLSASILLAIEGGYMTTMYWGTLGYKNQSQIVRDAKSLGIDMDVMMSQDNGYVRLKFNKDKPVYVTCDDYIDSKYVKHAVDYYNGLFEKINSSCKLELVNECDVNDKDVCIRIKSGDLKKENNYGLHEPELEFRSKKGTFIKDALITLDWDDLKGMDDLSINYVVIHELAHSLGLNDVYIDRGYNCINANTFMNTDNIVFIDTLFPSDYAMLQAVYSSSYKDYKDENDSLAEMKREIEEYTQEFYDYYSSLIKKRDSGVKSLDKDYLKDASFSFERRGYNFDVTINGRDCKVVTRNSENEIIDECEGKVNYSNGIFFLSDLKADKQIYIDYSIYDIPYKYSFVVYIDKYDHVIVTDHKGYIPSRLILNEKSKAR